MKKLLVLGLGLALAFPAAAQRSRHVRVEASGAQALAATLESAGFDVLEGSVKETSLELIVSDAYYDELVARGLEPQLIAVGRPYREIQAELLGEPEPDMPPPAGYADLAGLYAQMQGFASSFPGICQFVDLTNRYGTPPTAEGRHMFAVKISDNVLAEEDEPAFMIVSAHHCRELVTPVIALTAIENLVTNYASDPSIRAIVDGNEIWIAPIWNPDGYQYVFDVNNNWRKNRRNNGNGSFGVDLNRNYPFGWTSNCSGSSNTGSDTYKGPSAGSEPETQTMMAWSEAERFAKVLDFHSSGREVLWEYRCHQHPFASYLQSEAVALSQASTYNGSNRAPSAEGEHYEWQLATYGNHAFLIETHNQFQPNFASAQTEADRVWNGIEYFLELPIPVTGTVTDVVTGQPVEASISYTRSSYVNGETNTSGPGAGRYYAFPPLFTSSLIFSAPGYRDAYAGVFRFGGGNSVADVEMYPNAFCPSASVATRTAQGNVNTYTATAPVIGQPVTFTVNTSGWQFATIFAFTQPSLRNVDVGYALVELDSSLAFSIGPLSGPLAQTSMVVSNDPSTCGMILYTQVKLDNGPGPFDVTNAQDLILGF